MRVVLLGSGNVATHLGRALKLADHDVLQVWSRTLTNAKELGLSLSVPYTDKLEALESSADIYIIAVKDDAIGEVASSFPFKDKLLVHTSGTASMDLLGKDKPNAGVFYPLQTFSKHKEVSFSAVPLLIEGSNEAALNKMTALAASISKVVQFASSEQRALLHIAAVFACNFSNHLYTISKQLLEREGLNFNLLLPLIAETAEKVQNMDPGDAQTGPAARNDQKSIQKHKEYLESSFELLNIYTLMTNSILQSKGT